MSKKSLVLTLSEAELNYDYNKQPEEMLKNAEIDETIESIITEDTKEYYKEAPTRDEFREVLQIAPDQKTIYESGLDPYRTEIKEEIEEDIKTRVLRKLNEKRKKNEKRIIKDLEELTQFINENKENFNHWKFLTEGQKIEINPKLIFEYILSQTSELNREELKARFDNFCFLFQRAKMQKSLTLKENAERRIVEIEKEMLAHSKDYKIFFLQEHIDMVLKLPQKENKILFFCKLENFPRIIPNEVLEKLKQAEDTHLFEEFWILYLDYSKEKLQTTSQKIKEKDPILFGRLTKESQKLFYIADWIDELCDYTLEEMVKQLKQVDPKFEIPNYKGISPDEINSFFEEVKKKDEILNSTNASTWKDLYSKEQLKEKEDLQKLTESKEKKFTFKKMFGFKK